MLLNLDIWRDIIGYLEYARDKETLRSLALTSRCLSNLALESIWRNCEDILDIVPVINSFASWPDEPFLEFVHEPGNNRGGSDSDDEDTSSNEGVGGWVLNEPLPHVARKRALKYLAQIKKLSVSHDGPPDTSEPIWPILLASLSPRGPLLPNLRYLEIDYLIYDRNEYLIPLLSPSLKILVLNCRRLPKLRATLTLLNLAKASGCDLEEFTYDGPPIEYLPKAIARFKNLQNVVFSLDDGFVPGAPITFIDFIASLPSLCSLTCQLDTFVHLSSQKRFRHTSLQKLEIQSAPGAVRELFSQCVFPSVTEVKVRMDYKITSLEGLELSCPNTRKLSFYARWREGMRSTQLLEFNHIASLSTLHLWVFDLEVDHHNLTSSHLHTLAQSWPDLRSFRVSSFTEFDPLLSLIAFSNHSCLQDFDVKLPPNRLVDDIPKVQDLMKAHAAIQGGRSRLCSLLFGCSYDQLWRTLTVTEVEKRALVEYLYLLFPSLERLKFLGLNSGNSELVADFQEILLELRNEREEPMKLA